MGLGRRKGVRGVHEGEITSFGLVVLIPFSDPLLLYISHDPLYSKVCMYVLNEGYMNESNQIKSNQIKFPSFFFC